MFGEPPKPETLSPAMLLWMSSDLSPQTPDPHTIETKTKAQAWVEDLGGLRVWVAEDVDTGFMSTDSCLWRLRSRLAQDSQLEGRNRRLEES